jgi:hypothetical protein
MCKIVCLQPGQQVPRVNLENACYNNWHSFGLVTLDKGRQKYPKMDIIKAAEDEVDPNEVEKLLKEYAHTFRILHVRHNTAGASTLENAHPFDVYEDDTGLKIVFMHNGTLYDYKSKKTEGQKVIDDDSGPSDTKNFVDRVLTPFCNVDFGSGLGDIDNDLFRRVVDKHWPSAGGNRGVLISNRHQPYFLGDWKTVDLGGQKILCSNDSYWYSVQRGPEHTRRLVREEMLKQEAKEKAQETTRTPREIGPTTNPYVLLREWISQIRAKHPAYNLKESICDLINDWDIWDRDCAAQSLPYMTREELYQLYDHKEDFVSIADWVFSDYGALYEEYNKLDEKKKAAEKMISEMKKEIANLKKEAA